MTTEVASLVVRFDADITGFVEAEARIRAGLISLEQTGMRVGQILSEIVPAQTEDEADEDGSVNPFEDVLIQAAALSEIPPIQLGMDGQIFAEIAAVGAALDAATQNRAVTITVYMDLAGIPGVPITDDMIAQGQDAARSEVSAAIGARAFGGDVSAGEAYIVGERGMEVFVPHANGYIVPNVQSPTGSPSGITIHGPVNFYGVQDVPTLAAELENYARRGGY